MPISYTGLLHDAILTRGYSSFNSKVYSITSPSPFNLSSSIYSLFWVSLSSYISFIYLNSLNKSRVYYEIGTTYSIMFHNNPSEYGSVVKDPWYVHLLLKSSCFTNSVISNGSFTYSFSSFKSYCKKVSWNF